jgi:hypothetical protein
VSVRLSVVLLLVVFVAAGVAGGVLDVLDVRPFWKGAVTGACIGLGYGLGRAVDE